MRKTANILFLVFLITGTGRMLYPDNINNGMETMEVMYDTPPGWGTDSAGGEWVEYYNNTGSSINLTQFRLRADAEVETLSQVAGWGDITAVPDKSYFIICEVPSTAVFTNIYKWLKSTKKYLAQTGTAITLNNGPVDTLVLTNNTGDVLYQRFIPADNAVDASLRKVDMNSNEDLSASWVQADDPEGSPFYSGRIIFITNTLSDTFITKTNNHRIEFTIKSSLPDNGKIIIVYPSGFGLSSVTGISSADIDGSFARTVSSSTLTITRSGGTALSAGSYSLIVSNVANASVVGSYRLEMLTTDSGGTTIDGPDIGKSAFTLTPLTLSGINMTSSLTRKDAAGVTNTFSFKTYSSIPADGKIVLVYPSGYDVSGASVANSTSMDGSFSLAKTVTTITLIRSGGSAQTGGETENLKVGPVINPPAGSYSVQMTTLSNNNTVIDPLATSALFRIAWQRGDVVINEVTTDPQNDWSSSNFNGKIGIGAISDTDEWLELFIRQNNINLSNGWIICVDTSSFEGDLNNGGASSAFDTSLYTGPGSFAQASNNGYLVLGNPDGSSANNNDVRIELYDGNPAVAGNLIDSITIGQYDDGNIGDNAPDGGISDGAASGPADEMIARIPNGVDTDNDMNDTIKKSATIGGINDSSLIVLDRPNYATLVTFATVTLTEPDVTAKTTNCVITNLSYASTSILVTLYSNSKDSLGYTVYKGSFSFTNSRTSGVSRLGVTNAGTNYFKALYYDPSESKTKEAVAFWNASPPAGTTPGDAVINEFQTLSSDPVADAIEIFNRTASAIDLTGWKLKDIGGNTGYTFTETIQASNYILLSGLSSEWNNDDDAVLLENALGVIIDKIAYASAPASGSSLARKPNGTWSGTNVSGDFQTDATPTFGWNNDSTGNLGNITANKLFYFTTSATCFVTLTDADNPASPVTNVKVTNTTLGSTNWFNLPLTGAAGTYTGKFTFSATSHDSNAKVMLVTNANSIRIDYTDANPSGIRDIYPVKWYSVLPPQVKFSEVDSRGRWANNTQMEFVELYNPAGTQVNLTNWKITLDGGATLVTLTGKIPPYGFYLCAATGVTDISGHAPDQTWSVGYKLTDTDYGLQLITSGGAYVDSAGWGSASGIQTGYYEGTPLGNVGSSEYITFERKAAAGSTAASMAPPLGSECDSGNAYDTENNLSDFVRQNIMNPKSSQAAQEPPPHTVTLTKNRDITNTAYRGNTNVTALPFRFTDGLDRIMKKIRVRNLGTTAASDLAMVKLYRDNDNDFAKSPGDTRVADLAWDGSTGWTNNDLTMAGAATNTNGNYLITVNIRTNAVFGRTFIARIAPGDVSCDLGVLNTADLINNGYILIDSRAPAIGSRLFLSPVVVSNNNSQAFSLSALITNKGDGVVAKVYWYGHLTETNVYPTYTLSFKSGSTWSNGNLTIPKSVPPTNYILVLKASDLENYKSAYTNTLPLVLTVTGSFPPVIRSFTADKSTAVLNGTPDARIINFTTSATDRDTVMSNLTVILSNTPLALSGSMSNTGGGIWQAAVDFSSAPENNYILSTVVKDNSGYYSRQDLLITVRSNRSPVAAAGADQSVKGGATVLLDASASADPDSDPLSYSWEVITSPISVILYNTTSMTASFVAPNVTGDIIVRLTVRDPWLFSSTAQVTVHVNKAFPADLSQARPYNTVIRPGEKEVRFLNLSQGTTITIYTITGHKAAEVPAGSESEAVWQVPGHLASGVYIVYMKDAAGHTKKLKIIRVK